MSDPVTPAVATALPSPAAVAHPPRPTWSQVQVNVPDGTECGVAHNDAGLLVILVRRPGEPWPGGAEPKPESVHTVGGGHNSYFVQTDQREAAAGHDFRPDPADRGQCLGCAGDPPAAG